jgi:glutathione S-transferase
MASMDMQHFSRHVGNLYFKYLIKHYLKQDPDPQAVTEATAGFESSARILDEHLQNRDILVGDRLSVADFATAVALPYAEGAHLPLAAFPSIQR